jgi:hypothetical protein
MAQGGAPPTVSANVADRTDAVLFATAEDGSVWEYEPKFSLPKVRRFLRRASFHLYLEKRVLWKAIAFVLRLCMALFCFPSCACTTARDERIWKSNSTSDCQR